MAICDLETACDEIQSAFKASWDADPISTGIEVRWPNSDLGDVPPRDSPWVRLLIQHVDGDQRTLNVPGSRLFQHEGLVIVQVYVPVGRGLAQARKLAIIAKNAFEGNHTPSGVWFRRCRFQEVGRDAGNPEYEAWDQTNVISQFVWDEQR